MRPDYCDVNQLKERIDPVDFYTNEGQEIRSGGNAAWKEAGLCPFHEDRNAGSFYIHTRQGGYHCFACRAKGGDIIAFIQQKYSLSFREAVHKLQNDWGVV